MTKKTDHRKEKLKRLSGFEKPSIRRGNYIFYTHYFKDLKAIFDTYIADGDNVFDIGCGNKPYENYIQGIIKQGVYKGCDVVQSSENKVDILCEATNIPEPSEQYDVVICTQVIEHVFDHSKVFEEAYRLLKPGGRFIVSSNFIWEIHEAPYDFYRFTDECFKTLLTNAGFDIKESKANGGKWAVLGQLILLILSSKQTSKNRFFRALRYGFVGGVTVLCNLIFMWLDKKFQDANHYTLNYIFVGQKK